MSDDDKVWVPNMNPVELAVMLEHLPKSERNEGGSMSTTATWTEDEQHLGTDQYEGVAYFWAYDYKYPMRDVSCAARKRVHDEFVARGLKLDGRSKRHEAAIISALTAEDKRDLRSMYGDVNWAWWDC